jgi:hypothetical protein
LNASFYHAGRRLRKSYSYMNAALNPSPRGRGASSEIDEQAHYHQQRILHGKNYAVPA